MHCMCCCCCVVQLHSKASAVQRCLHRCIGRSWLEGLMKSQPPKAMFAIVLGHVFPATSHTSIKIEAATVLKLLIQVLLSTLLLCPHRRRASLRVFWPASRIPATHSSQ